MAAPPATIDPDIWERLRELAGDRLLIGQAEACRALGVSKETLVKEIEAGRLRYVLVGQRRRFKPLDIAQYIEQQTRSGVEEVGVPALPGMEFSGPPVSFAEALARTPGRSSAKKEAVRARKVIEAKRHDAWLKAQRRGRCSKEPLT